MRKILVKREKMRDFNILDIADDEVFFQDEFEKLAQNFYNTDFSEILEIKEEVPQNKNTQRI